MPLTTTSSVESTKAATKKAARIYEVTHSSASSLLAAFDLVRGQRPKGRGTTTDQEQDLLRAMLVMACAGLDATIKRLIHDALPELASNYDPVRLGLEKFISRQLKRDDGSTGSSGADLVARALASANPQQKVIDAYIAYLTGDSLQSLDQVLMAANALGLDQKSLAIKSEPLREAFLLRNKIIHELDIKLDSGNRARQSRKQADMTRDTDEVLRIARAFVLAVDGVLPANPESKNAGSSPAKPALVGSRAAASPPKRRAMPDPVVHEANGTEGRDPTDVSDTGRPRRGRQ